MKDAATELGLDDLYHMCSHIYAERNTERPVSATFAHFVEVCGMLTMHTREKVREEVNVEGALCKALGWFFPLMAKLGVVSVEELIFRKYPYACPYCRRCPHRAAACKEIVGSKTIDHDALRRVAEENRSRRPKALDAWQVMFEEIYNRDPGDKAKGRSIVGLFEELGELAEAVRVHERYPKYFVGEAADVFSYLMGIANEHAMVESAAGRSFSLQRAFVQRYPGMCVQCGYGVCVCPVVPEATVGRLAKELDLGEGLIGQNPISHARATEISRRVWEQVGGYSELAKRFPFDRGEANRSIVVLCVQLAGQIDGSRPEVARKLRDAAVSISQGATYAGSRTHSDSVALTVESLKAVWPLIESATHSDALGHALREASIRSATIGIVTALPKEFAAVRAMFDDSRTYKATADPNDYVVGTIPARDESGTHVVILALAKKMGNNAASITASNLLRSFSSVTDVLMVGIAAGAPWPEKPDKHVRLGDVVVSDRWGVIQYDNIKLEDQTVRIRSDSPPPSALMLGRVQLLEAERIAGQRPWDAHVARAGNLEACARPPIATDVLRAADGSTIGHPADATRPPDAPKVFYGRIGSANTLLKNRAIRDVLRDKEDIRAFEMEGSGIADGTWIAGSNYMLVRGICDYGDVSKDDAWQGYAAVVAAAYCRALIESISLERGNAR